MKSKSIFVGLCVTLCMLFTQYDQAVSKTTLEETLRQAFEYNPNIKAAEEARQEAVHRVREAKAGYFPTIGVWADGGYEQNDNVTTRINETENDVVSAYGAGVQFVQPIWKGGETMASVHLRSEELNYRALALMDSANSLAYSAISAHADILRRQKLIVLAQNNVNEHKKIIRLLRTRVEQGLSSQGDIDLVMGRLKRAEATLNLYKQGLVLAKAAYTKVTGQKIIPELLAVENPEHIFTSEDEARDISVRQNIRIKADMAAIRAALAEVNIDKSSFMPRLNLDGGTNFLDQDYDGNNKNLNWSVGLSMQWNIFNGGADVASVKASSARVRELRQNLHATMDSVNEEIVSAFRVTQDAEELQEIYELSASLAKKAKDNYTVQFEVGKKDLLSILDAEGEYFFSIVESEVNKTDALLGKYRLLAITGALLEEIGIDTVNFHKDANSPEEEISWNIRQDNSYFVAPAIGSTLNTEE